ncbi:coagulation factor 5/8 type domain-containing protein, partial [Streptomyces sp. SID11233]|nr:coagulation factor 5/8 type domain-containing protein [Streptomyces sp. SID11233]
GNDYKVFVPAKRENARGVSWNGTPQGQSVPLSQFYVAKPGVSADTLNQALDQGLNLLFTPGIYHLNKTVNVNRANTVVLGLGYATLIPDNGVTALKVADVDGVKLAGLLLDAGAVNSPSLLEVGTAGSHVDHAANPTSVQDVFARVGGAGPGKVTTAFVVNSDDTIIDHT